MDIFFLKLLLSFITGAAVVVGITTVSERVSTKLGGILTGIPSTAVIALLFIAWAQGDAVAIESTYAMTLGISAASLFVVVYFLSLGRFGRSFVPSIILSLGAWLVIAVPAATSKHGIPIAFAVFLPVFLTMFYFVIYANKQNPQGKKPKAEFSELITRAIFGGLVISLAVVAARFAGPLYGGVFGTFPAVFSSTFIILHSKHGPEFMREFMRTIPLGSFSGFAFAVSANHFCQLYGVLSGIIVAYGVAMLALITSWTLLEKLTAQKTKF
ncbi:MAG: DUF3147 family protein [Candidatus Micrarchaeota archaeon]